MRGDAAESVVSRAVASTYGVRLDAIQRIENILLAAPREARDLDFI